MTNARWRAGQAATCGGAAFVIVLCAWTIANAAPVVPEVIGKTGPTRSILPYYERLSSKPDAKQLREQIKLGQSLLPIRTPEMSPGPVTAREVDAKSLDQPFFIIGSDRASREWLAKNHARLIQSKAVGLLVQAESLEDLRAIDQLGEGIPIAPVSGSDIAKHLGITRYPILISRGWVEQ